MTHHAVYSGRPKPLTLLEPGGGGLPAGGGSSGQTISMAEEIAIWPSDFCWQGKIWIESLITCGDCLSAYPPSSFSITRSPSQTSRSRLAPSVTTTLPLSWPGRRSLNESSANVYTPAYQTRLSWSSLDRKWPV